MNSNPGPISQQANLVPEQEGRLRPEQGATNNKRTLILQLTMLGPRKAQQESPAKQKNKQLWYLICQKMKARL
jgi:hypothetical protein